MIEALDIALVLAGVIVCVQRIAYYAIREQRARKIMKRVMEG